MSLALPVGIFHSEISQQRYNLQLLLLLLLHLLVLVVIGIIAPIKTPSVLVQQGRGDCSITWIRGHAQWYPLLVCPAALMDSSLSSVPLSTMNPLTFSVSHSTV